MSFFQGLLKILKGILKNLIAKLKPRGMGSHHAPCGSTGENTSSVR